MYQISTEVSLFEKTYFVNQLYIVKYVFLHRHFSYMLNFWYNFESRYLFSKKKKKDESENKDYLKWFTAKSL